MGIGKALLETEGLLSGVLICVVYCLFAVQQVEHAWLGLGDIVLNRLIHIPCAPPYGSQLMGPAHPAPS